MSAHRIACWVFAAALAIGGLACGRIEQPADGAGQASTTRTSEETAAADGATSGGDATPAADHDAPPATGAHPPCAGGPPPPPPPGGPPPPPPPGAPPLGGVCGSCAADWVCCSAPEPCAGSCVPDCRLDAGRCPPGLTCEPASGVCKR